MLNHIEKFIEITLNNEGLENTVAIVTNIYAVFLDEENVFKFEFVYKTNSGRGDGSGYFNPKTFECFHIKL